MMLLSSTDLDTLSPYGNPSMRRSAHDGVCGRVERTPPVCRCALYSLFAPAFRSRECHTIPSCTVVRLPLTEACLRNCRTSLFMPPFTRRDRVGSNVQAVGADVV